MTDVAPRCSKSCGQMGRFNGAGKLEKDSRQHQAFHKSQVVGSKSLRRNRVETQRRPLDREHGTLAKEGFNAHHGLR